MYKVLIAMGTLVLALPVLGDGFESGSDGSDGALDCAALFAMNPECTSDCDTPCTVQILLGLAETGPWDKTPHTAGVGVYDPVQWAVVYQYTMIDIPEGVIVTFGNHHSGAPVMWLATEDVMIAGSVRVDGADGSTAEGFEFAVPGPGGFGGGTGLLGGSVGFGPGGGSRFGASGGGGGGYGTAGGGSGGPGGPGGGVAYGTDSIVPLIGGSGGSLGVSGGPRPGGAGGGAILIASSGDITLDSTGGIFANGGGSITNSGGAGSGGGIRLVAKAVLGSGILRAVGGAPGNGGGFGRIRVDAANGGMNSSPPISPGDAGPIFPEAPAPRLRATAVNGIPVPVDPLATVLSGDVSFSAAGEVTIEIEALNSPEAAGMNVNVRIVQADGLFIEVVQSTPLADGDKDGILTATAVFNFGDHPPGKWEVHLSVQLP